MTAQDDAFNTLNGHLPSEAESDMMSFIYALVVTLQGQQVTDGTSLTSLQSQITALPPNPQAPSFTEATAVTINDTNNHVVISHAFTPSIAGPLEVLAFFKYQMTGLATSLTIQVKLDGTAIPTSPAMNQPTPALGTEFEESVSFQIASVSAAAHTLTLEMQLGGLATLTVNYAQAGVKY